MTRQSLSFRLFLTFLGLSLPIVGAGLWFLTGIDGPIQKSITFWIVDSFGNVEHANTESPLPIDWKTVRLPERLNEFRENTPEGEFVRKVGIIRITGERETFLVVLRDMGFTSILHLLFKVGFPIVLFCVLICSAVFIAYLRRKSRVAESVLAEIKNGNLDARFSVNTMDELSRLMSHFNEMADQVKESMTKLRQTEASRTELLRGLAHDIKTPLTAIRLALENLAEDSKSKLTRQSKLDLATALDEVGYFQKLIEDLFLLAQMDGFNRATEIGESILLEEVLERELASQRRMPGQSQPLKWELMNRCKNGLTLKANPYLIQRLLRNTLNNAARFANRKVTVTLTEHPDRTVEIIVQDDGPGFSEESLAHYGQRRNGRFIDFTSKSRISLGLGSVIMRSIVTAYGGTIEVRNGPQKSALRGAQVRIILPLSDASQKKAA